MSQHEQAIPLAYIEGNDLDEGDVKTIVDSLRSCKNKSQFMEKNLLMLSRSSKRIPILYGKRFSSKDDYGKVKKILHQRKVIKVMIL